jgi:uridine kinase
LFNWRVCAIDGYAAAGKTTLANQLARDFKDLFIVSLDDFFLPGERRRASVYAKNFDLDRLQMQVLEPLLAGSDIRYQPFDWANMVPSREFIRIPKDSRVIIDGTYSLDLKLRHSYDFGIWVDTPDSVRMTRKMDRGLSHQEASMHEGIEELTYTTALEPRSYASLVLKGAAAFPPTAEIFDQLAKKLGSDLYTQNPSSQGI